MAPDHARARRDPDARGAGCGRRPRGEDHGVRRQRRPSGARLRRRPEGRGGEHIRAARSGLDPGARRRRTRYRLGRAPRGAADRPRRRADRASQRLRRRRRPRTDHWLVVDRVDPGAVTVVLYPTQPGDRGAAEPCRGQPQEAPQLPEHLGARAPRRSLRGGHNGDRRWWRRPARAAGERLPAAPVPIRDADRTDEAARRARAPAGAVDACGDPERRPRALRGAEGAARHGARAFAAPPARLPACAGRRRRAGRRAPARSRHTLRGPLSDTNRRRPVGERAGIDRLSLRRRLAPRRLGRGQLLWRRQRRGHRQLGEHSHRSRSLEPRCRLVDAVADSR